MTERKSPYILFGNVYTGISFAKPAGLDGIGPPGPGEIAGDMKPGKEKVKSIEAYLRQQSQDTLRALTMLTPYERALLRQDLKQSVARAKRAFEKNPVNDK